MSRTTLFAAALAASSLVAAPALAQRGSGSRAAVRTPVMDKEDFPKGPTLRARDLEDQSPLKLLIDKRKDLKLTDAQLSQMKDAEGKLRDKNAPLYKAADSLIHEMRPAYGTPTDDDRSRLRNARAGMQSLLETLRAGNDSAAKAAVATLDAEQQTKANELVAKQREDADKAIREKLFGGGDRGGDRGDDRGDRGDAGGSARRLE